jgi:2-dehydropantoate 2-reductase
VRVGVVGAGAIGAVLAEAAVASGHEVVVCVRTPIEGLSLKRGGVVVDVDATFTTAPAAPPCDVVLVTTKATDTRSTAPALAVLCGPETLTVCVQNGLDQELRLAPVMPAGAGPVSPALAYIAAERVEPGRVRHFWGDLLMVPAEHAERLRPTFGERLRVRGVDDLRTEAWRKLLANLVTNPITALVSRRVEITPASGLGGLARSILTEAVAVAVADGADLDESEVETILTGIEKLGVVGSSMLYDRQAGRPMEHQYLNGAVVRRGVAYGIPTPVNATLVALLDELERPEPTPPARDGSSQA